MKDKQKTIADIIRSMSDEQLANWLTRDAWDCNDCPEHERIHDYASPYEERCDMACAKHCLEWLKKPVTNNEN